MKARLAFVAFLLLTTAASLAQQHEQVPDGVIYGIVIGQDGRPAKGIRLVAYPLGVGFGAPLPAARTNDNGEFRFEQIPWWGKYTVFANDEDAGYSDISSGVGSASPPEVELTPEHREAEIRVYLPPKAGFIEVHLTNRKTGAAISGMRVAVMTIDNPQSPLFTTSCESSRTVLVPPDKDLLLHVTSDGYREWDESVGRGKTIHLPSANRLTLSVKLEPLP